MKIFQNWVADVRKNPQNYVSRDDYLGEIARKIIAQKNAKAAEEKEIKEIKDKKDAEKLSLEMQEKKIQEIKNKYNNEKLNKEIYELEKKLMYNNKEKNPKKLNNKEDINKIYRSDEEYRNLNDSKTINLKDNDLSLTYLRYIKSRYPDIVPHEKTKELQKDFTNALNTISNRIYEENKTEDSSDSEENIKIKKEADKTAYFLLEDIYYGNNNLQRSLYNSRNISGVKEDNKLNYNDRIDKYENLLKISNLKDLLQNNEVYKNELKNKKTHDPNAVPLHSALNNKNRARFEESKDESGAMESKEGEESNASVDYLREAINNNDKPKKQVSFDNNISGGSRKLKDIGSAIPPSYGPFYPEEEELSKEDLEQKIALELEESKKHHKNIDINNENLKIPTGAQQINEHAPVWLQELKKGILLKHIDLMNAPPLLYPGSKIAKPSQLQTYARDLLYKENPELPERRQQQQDLEDELANFKTDKVAHRATKGYLERATQSPKTLHENLFKDYEKDFDEDIRRKSRQELTQKIIPSIVGKDAMKGIRFSGHGARDVDEAIENYMKGTTSAILQNKNQQRQSSINAGMHYADQQAKAAQTSLNAAVQDRRNSIEAIDTLNTARRKNLEDLSVHQMKVHNAGVDEQNRAQQLINEKVANFEKKENHQLNHLGLLSNTLNAQKHDVQWNKSEPRPDHVPYQTPVSGNLKQNMGGYAFGMGNQQMPHNQPHKKGGRVYKAKGGQIDMLSNAVQNAVIDKEDPLQALQRLFRHQQALQSMQKQNRPAYAEGGQINPIQAGAMQAKEYVNSEAKRNQINFVRNRPQMSSWGQAHNAGIAAMAKTPGILGKIASGVAENNRENKLDNDKRHADLERTYAMEHELAQEQRNQELAERKMVAHESQVKDNSLTNQLKRLKYQAEIKKLSSEQTADNNLFGDDSIGVPEQFKQRNHKKEFKTKELEYLEKVKHRAKVSGELNRKNKDLKESIEKVPTGTLTGFISAIPSFGLSESIADLVNKLRVPNAEVGDVKTFNKDADQVVQKTKELASLNSIGGGRLTNDQFQAMVRAKPEIGAQPKQNKKISDDVDKVSEDQMKSDLRVLAREGYSPREIWDIMQENGVTLEDMQGKEPTAQPTAQPAELQQPSHQIINNPTHSVLSDEERQAKKDKIEKLRRKFS